MKGLFRKAKVASLCHFGRAVAIFLEVKTNNSVLSHSPSHPGVYPSPNGEQWVESGAICNSRCNRGGAGARLLANDQYGSGSAIGCSGPLPLPLHKRSLNSDWGTMIFFFFFFFLQVVGATPHSTWAPQSGTKSTPPAWAAWSLNHWATRKNPWEDGFLRHSPDSFPVC